ncbi:MAG: hypothetical protein B6I20_05225 [Bacteroidetes bacterium 4572_117]|nr:MAG: hypothetical protein B6I20_05225 [Bacteroidetes bacterium 4572_117]
MVTAYSYQCFAQTNPINLDSLARMPLGDFIGSTVIGVSKYKEVSTKSPASVYIITESQIKENCYQDLSDVLKNVIAIDVVDNARGFGEYYTFRGIEGNDRFLVLVDGQKINPASGTFLSIGNSISINFAKQIEIIYGPSSVMYGADAFAGIINIVSKDVDDKLDITANIDYGSMNTISGEIAAQFQINKNLSFSAFTRVFKSDGPDFIGRDTVYDIIKQYHYPQTNKFEQPINDHTIFLKTKYKNFTLSYFKQHFDEGNALGQQTRSIIYNKECKWEMDNHIVWLNYDKQINENSNILFKTSFANHTQDPETQFYKWHKTDILEKSFSQYMTGIDNTFRGSVSYKLDLSKKKNLKLITGIEYEFTNSIPPYANDQVLASYDKFVGETAETIKRELTINEQRYASFAQLTYTPTKKMNFVIGGRYDYSLRNKETFNPRLSFVYTPFEKTVLKFMVGTAFQAPSLFYQYEQWGANTAVMLSASEVATTEPGWKLENQKVISYDTKISQRIGDNVVLNLSLFHNNLSNLIERNVYTSSAYYAYLSYSFTDAYAKKDGEKEYIPRIAKHKLWFGLIYKNLFDHLNVSARIKWIGDVVNRNIDVYPTGKQPGYFNMDISLRTTNILKFAAFYVKLENVFNTDIMHGGLFDQTVYLPHIPQVGFVGKLGVEIRLNK